MQVLNELCFNFPAYKEKVNSNPNGSLGPKTHQKAPGSRWAPHPRSFPVWATSHPIVPVFEKMSCRMRGRRVTIPEPRGRKSLWEGKGSEITHEAGLQGGQEMWPHGVEQSPLAIWVISAKRPTPAGYQGTL